MSSSSQLSGSFINDAESEVGARGGSPAGQADGKGWAKLVVDYLELIQEANRKLVRELRKREAGAEICLHCGDLKTPDPQSQEEASHDDSEPDVPYRRLRRRKVD